MPLITTRRMPSVNSRCTSPARLAHEAERVRIDQGEGTGGEPVDPLGREIAVERHLGGGAFPMKQWMPPPMGLGHERRRVPGTGI